MVDFILHRPEDSVGVVVVNGIHAGMERDRRVMDDDRMVRLKAIENIPIGHKLVVRDIHSGETVIKYGLDMGRAIVDIHAGAHAHVHNIKTKRW